MARDGDSLGRAKKAKQDEFYTQFHDIQKEVNAYLEFNPDVFRGKTVLLPCDDPDTSNFTKFFAQNFETFGLKKLISTSYVAPENTVAENRGKLFVVDKDITGDGRVDIEDIHWTYLEGNGDFRSAEVCRLRDEADIIVTNPPFSQFRDFLAWIMVAEKSFLIIGNMNAITYKEVFPLLKANRMWLGKGFQAGNAYFRVAGEIREYANGVYDKETNLVKFRNCCWFTNLEHGRRHQSLSLMTMADNIKFSKHKEVRGTGYRKYDNYDAIEVPFTDAIPADYDGAMGVPISFMDKYCPEQFEILGITKTWFGGASKMYPLQIQVDKTGKRTLVSKLNDGAVLKLAEAPKGEVFYIVDEEYYTQVYARILIRFRRVGGGV